MTAVRVFGIKSKLFLLSNTPAVRRMSNMSPLRASNLLRIRLLYGKGSKGNADAWGVFANSAALAKGSNGSAGAWGSLLRIRPYRLFFRDASHQPAVAAERHLLPRS